LVDLVNLPKHFSWRRYPIELMGFLAAVLFVAFLMGLLEAISQLLLKA
jgi:hypothetical protein